LALTGVRNAVFRGLSIKDVSNAAVYTRNLVTNTFEGFVCSYHEPTQSIGFNVRPQYGIVLDSDTTTQTFIEPVIEGMQAIGIWTKGPDNGSYGNTFINGTSEGNPGKGAVFDSVLNTVINTDFEANGGSDIEINQSRNALLNVVAAGSVFIKAGQGNRISGGQYGNISIAHGVDQTVIDGPLINGAFTDSNPTRTTLLLPRVETLGGGLRYDVSLGNVLPRLVTINLNEGQVVTDAHAASHFTFNVFEGATLANPVNPVNGQRITWTIASGPSGPYTLTFGSKFRAPAGRKLPTSIPTSSFLVLTASYSSPNDVWIIEAAPPKSGTVTFSTAGSVTVTFTIPEPDANYKVVLTGNASERFSWSNKTTSGFTVLSDNPPSTASVDWMIVR
jgi:hypothetical protein